jgi:hypothetical protein
MMMRDESVAIENKRYYVLIPLPDSKRENCLSKESGGPDYISKTACDKHNKLTQANFNELVALAKSLITRLQKSKDTRHVHAVPITFADVDILKNLRSNDVLYVTAHGSPSLIGTQYEGVNLTPEQLARAFLTAGLSKSLNILKLMACDTAIDAKNVSVYGSSKEKPKGSKSVKLSFAESFRVAMVGYENLDVAGYLGKVADIHSAKQKNSYHSCCRFFGETNSLGRASQSRIIHLSPNTKHDPDEVAEKNESTVEFLRSLV